MNLWYKKASIFILAGIAYSAGIFFSNPAAFGFCIGMQSGSYICRIPGAINIGWSFTSLGQTLAVVALIMLFANTIVFHKWLRFSLYYIPIAIVLTFWMYPTKTPLGGTVPLSQGVILFGGLYAIITFGILLWHLFVMRKRTSR